MASNGQQLEDERIEECRNEMDGWMDGWIGLLLDSASFAVETMGVSALAV
jgi:hypothetical protein